MTRVEQLGAGDAEGDTAGVAARATEGSAVNAAELLAAVATRLPIETALGR